MKTHFIAVVTASALATIPATATAAQPHAGSACTGISSAARAAQTLYGPGTELVRTERIAGMRTALVLEPRIAPGTRRRMIHTPSGWCDAATGFNRAIKRTAGGRATAAAFAKVAAAPYFDGVTVKSVRRTAAGVHVVRTHARTNGVEARWVVATDASGVRTATWTATAFARKPFVAETEGLSALPGGTETYTRLASGLLAERRGLPTAETARRAAEQAPSVPAIYTGPDGMQIRLSVGDARVAVDPGVRTGVDRADVIRDFMESIKLNYEEFHDWGFRKGWESDLDPVLGSNVGWVYVNDALSAYCWACVFIANDFQIHMTSEIVAILTALGFDGYANPKKAFDNVMGHEMFHNFQNAYNNPGPLGRGAGRSVSTAYSEGTARFQETLHSYSDVSFANKTLYTGGQTNPPGLSLDANHCNGYGNPDAARMETAFADGPFTKSYNACYFWTSWFNQNGGKAFVDLISEAYPEFAPKSPQEEGVKAISKAAGVPGAKQLAFFAHSALTGKDKVIKPMSGDGPARDWGSFLFKWAPAELAPGGSAGRSIGGGGVFGRKLTTDASVSLSGEGLALYEVRADEHHSVTRPLQEAGANVRAPKEGESVWVVAVNPTVAAVTATIKAD